MADNKQTFNYTYSSINKAEIEKMKVPAEIMKKVLKILKKDYYLSC